MQTTYLTKFRLLDLHFLASSSTWVSVRTTVGAVTPVTPARAPKAPKRGLRRGALKRKNPWRSTLQRHKALAARAERMLKPNTVS